MAGQLETQINRFKVNEERVNTFVNVDGFYTTSSGVQVPTLLNVSKRIEASVENVSLAEQSASIEITRQTDLVIAASTSAQEEFLNEDSKINTLAKNTIAEWQAAIALITQTEGVPALAVSTANNETQQSINDSVGAKWYAKEGGYSINYRVRLENGDIVKSTINGNTNNPNVDMAGWVKTNSASQIFDESGKSQQEINNNLIHIKKSVDEMLAISNPQNGKLVRTLGYHDSLSKGGNLYCYESARQLENDGGSVINGWVVQDKTALTVWDFGYKDGGSAVSRTALTNALASNFPLELLAETLDAHIGSATPNYVHWQTISQNKLIFGKGRDVSVIKGLRLQSHSDVLIAKDFSINENGLNYALFPAQYNYLLIDNFSSKGNLDAVLVMGAKSAQSKALIRNCYSENSGRIGFTADVGATNVIFEKCYSFNCRQGFHAEEVEGTKFIDCTADTCGNNALPPIPADYNQPAIYAGGFRLHKYRNVSLIRCKNINKNGANIDWLGGGGSNLNIQDCVGLRFYTDDVGGSDPESSFTYTDIEVYRCKEFSLANQQFKSIFTGRFVLEDIEGGNIEIIGGNNYLSKNNQITYAYLEDIKCGRLQLSTSQNEAFLYMNNVHSATQYYNEIKGFTYFNIGHISYAWLTGDESQWPTLGFRFIANKAKTFHLQSFTSTLRGLGTQISLESINPSIFKGGSIGKVIAAAGAIDAFVGVDFNALNITYVRKASTVANATGADNTANTVNALITSLRNAGYIS